MTMRERMARAMCAIDGLVWEHQANPMTSGSGGNDEAYYCAHADAALDCLTVPPSEAMLAAAHQNCPTCGGASESWPQMTRAMIEEGRTP